ncbi:MAG: hypothetical protein GY773_07920 [Actinomycetia bacterium]|nr:hypothetical protein [Actinomycetes bacterium]
MKTWVAVATVVAMVASACGGGDEPAPAQVGLAESDAGGASASSEAGDADADASGGEEAENDGPGASTIPSGTDAKTLAAVAVSELPEAGDAGTGPTVGTPDEAEVVFGTFNDGAIESAFGVDRWTFDGEEGQLLGIDMIKINGEECHLDLSLVLVSPDGYRGDGGWVGNGGCEVQGPFELDQSGQHTIEFVGGDGAIIDEVTGDYRFVPTLLTEHDVAPLVFDQSNDGEIVEILGVDRWTFDGETGALLTIDVLSIDHGCNQDLTMTLEDPLGEREEVAWVGNRRCSVHGRIGLGRGGPYVLELFGGSGAVIDDKVGAYRLVPSFLTELDVQVASPEQALEGEISQVLGIDRWTFDAAEGDMLEIDVISIDHECRQDLTMTLEDPLGEREELAWVGNNGCRTHGPYELGRGGTYIIEFSGGTGSVIEDNLGAYNFSFTLG